MQPRQVRKRMLWGPCAWLGMTVCAFFDASPTLARPSHRPGSPFPGDAVSGALPGEDAAGHIRALAQSTRPEAWSELATFSLTSEVTGRASTLILAIRVLARAPEHEAAQKALLRHLVTLGSGDAPELRRLARAVAAQALAVGNRPDSQRALLLLASGPADRDPELQALARAALLAHPLSDDEVQEALPWLDSAGRRAKLAWMREAVDTSQRKRAERCDAAKAGVRTLRERGTTEAVVLLSDLADCPSGRGPTSADWAELAASSSTWALRGMAATGLGQGDAAWQARAEHALRQKDPNVRAAAAWFLATQSPKAAERLAQDSRPEVRAAAKNQLATVAPDARAPGCPRALASLPTSQLLERFAQSKDDESAPLLGCLASRPRQEPGPGLSTVELQILIERSAPRARFLAAINLGDASSDDVSSKMRSLARGLSERLYARESDDHVRGALCQSLAKLGVTSLDALARDLRIDPSPLCRAVGSGTPPDVPGQSTLLATSRRSLHLAVRSQAGPLWLVPAPDGFVGARVLEAPRAGGVRLDFVDCRETAAPPWACGPTGLPPG